MRKEVYIMKPRKAPKMFPDLHVLFLGIFVFKHESLWSKSEERLGDLVALVQVVVS